MHQCSDLDIRLVTSYSSSFLDRGDLTMAAHQNPESNSSNSSIGCCNGVNYSFDYTFGCCSRVDPAAISKKSILPRSGNPDVHQRMVIGDGRNPRLASSVVKLRAFESKSGTAEAGTSSTKDGEKKGRVCVCGGGVAALVSSVAKLCGRGLVIGPFVHQAEDIDLAAEFVEAGASLVMEVAEEVKAIAHVAQLSAAQAEALAIKVDATTKLVKKRIDEIAYLLEGEKNMSTILANYAAWKKDVEMNDQH